MGVFTSAEEGPDSVGACSMEGRRGDWGANQMDLEDGGGSEVLGSADGGIQDLAWIRLVVRDM